MDLFDVMQAHPRVRESAANENALPIPFPPMAADRNPR
jgi:hypothetical protein